MKTRSELKREYKEARPAMGVLVVRNMRSGRFQLHAARDLRARMNRLAREITPATSPNRELLHDWQTLGREAFEIRVLDELEPKDAPGWDPTEDLKELERIWRERLVAEGGVPY